MVSRKVKDLTEQELTSVLGDISEGVSLKRSLESMGVDRNAAYLRLMELPGMDQAITHARAGYLVSEVHKLNDFAMDESLCPQRAKLVCDNIKWEVSKMLPKIYGDKLQIDATVQVDIQGAMALADKRLAERLAGEVIDVTQDHIEEVVEPLSFLE